IETARAEGADPVAATAFEAVPGLGLRAEVEGRRVELGTLRLFDQGVTEPVRGRVAELAALARSPVVMVVDGRLAALMAVADKVRADAPAALEALRAKGLSLAM